MGDRINETDGLYRSIYTPGVVSYRADDATESLGELDILFARFNSWNEIDSYFEGRFLESVAPGTFRKTMSERAEQIVSLFNHGHDPQIGEKLLGEIVDMGERQDDGPFLRLALDDTSYTRDLRPALARGGYGASYMFRVTGEDWKEKPGESEYNPQGLPERTIHEVLLYEAGPVTFPADPSTVVKMRSKVGGQWVQDRFHRNATDYWRQRGGWAGEPPTDLATVAEATPPPEPQAHSTVSTTPTARGRHDAVAWLS